MARDGSGRRLPRSRSTRGEAGRRRTESRASAMEAGRGRGGGPAGGVRETASVAENDGDGRGSEHGREPCAGADDAGVHVRCWSARKRRRRGSSQGVAGSWQWARGGQGRRGRGRVGDGDEVEAARSPGGGGVTTGDDIGSVTRRGRSFKRAPCEGEEGPGGVREGRRRRRFASGTSVRGEVIEQGRSSPCADAYVCVLRVAALGGRRGRSGDREGVGR